MVNSQSDGATVLLGLRFAGLFLATTATLVLALTLLVL